VPVAVVSRPGIALEARFAPAARRFARFRAPAGQARRLAAMSPPAAGRAGTPRLGLHLEPGMRVGLFGGSFDPAHEGHAHVARTAMRRLGLDRVIWLVSPQNPLKPAGQAAELPHRMASARRFARGPRMIVSDLEARIGASYTIDTVRALKARFPGVRFVWIMGADGLAEFHRWRGWAQILRELPVAVVSRPGIALRARLAPAARRFARFRTPADRARGLAGMTPPAWVFLTGPFNFQSSTALRARARQTTSSGKGR
jgi:nicotinate-nucleotide adenylyltransferase